MPLNTYHHRIRGLATLRRLGQDVRSAFSKDPQATSNASDSGPASSIYAERLLSGNQIRVLHIRPSPKRDRQLECTLKLVNLDDAPVYEALSYVWGTDSPSVPIVCNCRPLTIRPELSYALVRLRLKHTTRIIWADALCINQDDNEEKSHQVPLMRKIYSQALQVNVWLGRGDESVIREAFECCKLVANACRKFNLEHDVDLNDRTFENEVEVPSGIFTRTVCKGLTDLFDRPLFSRVWCIQEIKLAQDALVIWGEQYLSWAEVGLTASWMFRQIYFVADSNEASRNEASRNALKEMYIGNVDIIFKLDPVNCTLLSALHDFRDFQSTDPRDKVYGLIGLAGSQSDGGMMLPDYTKSTAQVFTDTALHIITSTKDLLVFAHVAHHADYDGDVEYRSWVPRWDNLESLIIIRHAFVVEESGACGGREAQFIVSKDSGQEQLCLTGIFYATVTTFDGIMDISPVSITRSDGLHVYEQVVEVIEGIDWNDPMSDVTLPVLARTLTAGMNAKFHYLNMLDDNSRCAHHEAFRHYIEWYRTPTADFDNMSDDARQYHELLATRSWNRRFFWTSRKDYGIGPVCMREGDIVVLLYGSNAPCVLRPKGDRYLLLGEAYVDSIMNGELVREVEEGKRQEQEFCLI